MAAKGPAPSRPPPSRRPRPSAGGAELRDEGFRMYLQTFCLPVLVFCAFAQVAEIAVALQRQRHYAFSTCVRQQKISNANYYLLRWFINIAEVLSIILPRNTCSTLRKYFGRGGHLTPSVCRNKLFFSNR